jgi:hypothetical protein
MLSLVRILVAALIAYSLNLALDWALAAGGFSGGSDAHPQVAASAVIFAAHLAVAIAAGVLCAVLAGPGRTLPATLLLLAIYMAGGIRAGRELSAAGHLPFSSAIVTLLCVSFAPIGPIVYANRVAKRRGAVTSKA